MCARMLDRLYVEIAPPVEAASCNRPSANFKGPCFNDHHCNRVCMWEGNGSNTGGFCGTNELKCYCEYNCNMSTALASAPGVQD
jgi:hypothetical protein